MYNKVDSSKGTVNIEKDIAKLWKEKDIIKKSFDSNQDGEYFTFYDGPPTANGRPHVGHILTRVMKDIIPRYKVMKGHRVLRKAGWDTHGLPVELEIEKKLGISGKEQIEDFGVEKFIKECKDSVFSYVSLWEDMSHQIGYWVDMEDPYVTYHDNYIESEWWALKKLWDKGLLYKGHKVMPYCPRCGTALSSHEVAQGYKDVKDLTATAKFKVKGEENKYILAWTTTPWTLPSNLALCINKAYTYADVKVGDEVYVLAKDLIGTVLKDLEHEVIKEYKGEELLGTEYEQLMPFAKVEGKAFVVIHGDYVTLSDGTGIVHIAPAYGEDDSLVAKQNGIAFVNLVDASGNFVSEVTPWAGKFVKKCDESICNYLEENNKLFDKHKHLHSYPHCWRCDTPLLYYPKDSWFVAMTQMRDKLLENNDKVNWYPDNIRTGRFGKFLENVIDWGISRDRYWGTPLPIWQCECGHRDCIGSRAELEEKATTDCKGIELHKPYVDGIKLKCPDCGKEMTRTNEVIDCWFDSGSMPFAQWHYPFENKEKFEKNFPAQFISEAVDQTRGWFYTLMALSTCLFDTNPFENCIVLGHVLDKKGLKMSKSKGNVVDPFEVLNSQGADATRWHFYTASAPWLPTRFSVDDVAETQRKFLGTLWNVYSFYVLYAEIDNFDPTKYADFVSENVMDKWIISKLNTLIETVDDGLNTYKITQAALAIEDFTDELSNWYVRRNRARYWTQELTDDKIGAYVTLYKVLVNLVKVASPFVPFMTEEIYQNLVLNLDKNAPESIHLCSWPEVNKEAINEELEKEMDLAYTLVKLGRSARNAANIKNRQPLSELLISTKSLPEYYGDIVKEELNIKMVELGADLSKYVNFEIKPNLPVIGKMYGKLIPQIKKAISEKNQMELAQKIQNGESETIVVNDTEIVLTNENLLVTMQGLEGYAFAGEGELGVVLDTTVTPELQEEGHVREIISKIQNMRKDKGFEVADKIKLYVANNDMLVEVIKKFEETIKKETLTNEVIYNKEADYSEAAINGEILKMTVEVIK
ncbi:isoleucine--tRNA ligase [Clostridium saccharoperbutylacetonicum]|uniref:Isoleucine--tRNA ligase n=2 Tax=Clostridium TaxID=1485 RepID=M1MQJ0_9CLOT|nr:isoleucine--tRNA ligase [Clostridium saccharoperbutylacetonicum]AGF53892.1 isoleucine--tRNA ligase IleS [Clostridium saccharoperbutylacetonicum N1-4(HMT)]AQR92796.1 isoleucine--tRNA ligase [Clostridium saccharoperbutylacetonicum]NRT59595.1 isoleucyl-tRNA synthetase [Clostridium saccharoperbutylacetonicum]NSB28787.1 isoleucyl-tRNA synthetase [Clostridium saccharoperbutylacetonicum]NSB34207.1 isoleucyl-tRNA synthetase [Clostridium saccharoperbutylacetonicum]